MKVVVVYDSQFGNTERVARAIAEQLGAGEPAAVVAAGAASARDLAGMDLLAVGGPTQGHGLSPALKAFLVEHDRRRVGPMEHTRRLHNPAQDSVDIADAKGVR